MVEDVEGLCAELKVYIFPYGKVLEQPHIEIRAIRQGQNVAAGIAISESLRSAKGITVVKPGPLDSAWMPDRDRTVDRPNDISVGLDGSGAIVADGVSGARIVCVGGVHNAE